MPVYIAMCMVSFNDDQASAMHIYNQAKAVAVNASVERIGEPGERTSYCGVYSENSDGSLTPVSVWSIDLFGIVREGSPDQKDAPDWIRPAGAHDAYPAANVRGGETVVTHNSIEWVNTHGNGNVWEPGIFGWVAR